METSKHHDRERRRTKSKAGNWAKFLVRPQTVTLLVSIGRLVAFALWIVRLITDRLRE